MGFCYMKSDSELPAFYQFPEFLLNMNLSQTARIIYMLLYDRSRISQMNKWLDECENVYVIFPLKELAHISGRSMSAVKCAMSELEGSDLILRKNAGFSKPNHINVRIPDSVNAESTGVTKRAFIKPENNTFGSRNSSHSKGRFQTPNKVIETNKKNKNTGIRMPFPDYSCEEGESL